MTIKGAIFDMDGTLVDSLGFWGIFWEKFGQRYLNANDFYPDPELDKAARTTIFKDVIALARNYYSISEDIDEMMEFSEGVVYDFYHTKASVKSGAIEFLEYLKLNNVKISLASASDKKYINAAFETLGLDKYFDNIVSCADIGKSKEYPDVFYRAAQMIGEKVEDICVFEDSFVALQTAKNAGFLTVGVFDKNNYSQDMLKSASDIYLSEGMGMDKLIPLIHCLT
ncbi:MAG: HAD family phosphatase [Ruminococcaceae bacterium]|nr:HAD family phosphatase [Oscillospiraceae bacterium]